MIFDAHVTLGRVLDRDYTPEGLLADMDRFGIDRALVSPMDRWLAVDNREGNDALVRWSRQWPDRLNGWAAANPWLGERAVAELARGLDLGLRGIKLHPGRQGFILVEAVAQPILALAALRRVPVYVVTGIANASTPLQLVELARQYPEIAFIMGRSGRTDYGWLDLLPSIKLAPNIYLETPYNLPGLLENIVAAAGRERLLFASDLPLTNVRLELEKIGRMRIDAEARAAIMGGNLTRLLKNNDRHCEEGRSPTKQSPS